MSYVNVQPSTIINGGDGLFAILNIPKNKIFCFYSGSLIDPNDGNVIMNF
jgi:hypothetical protein